MQARQRRGHFFPAGSPLLNRLAERMRLAASVLLPVVLVGERGSGKRTVAGVIYDGMPCGNAASRHWIAAGSLPGWLRELLLGHGGGAQRSRAGDGVPAGARSIAARGAASALPPGRGVGGCDRGLSPDHGGVRDGARGGSAGRPAA